MFNNSYYRLLNAGKKNRHIYYYKTELIRNFNKYTKCNQKFMPTLMIIQRISGVLYKIKWLRWINLLDYEWYFKNQSSRKFNLYNRKINDRVWRIVIYKFVLIFLFSQKTFKNFFFNIRLPYCKIFRFFSKKSIKIKNNWNVIYALYITLFKYLNISQTIIMLNINHINFFKNIDKFLMYLLKYIKSTVSQAQIDISVKKPNFFFINVQYKKIKSVKKSRKKLLYSFLKK